MDEKRPSWREGMADALGAAAGGLAGVAAGAMLHTWLWSRPGADNYRNNGFMAGIVEILFWAFGVGLVGAYVGAGLAGRPDAEGRLASPAAVALGAALGALGGSAAGGVAAMALTALAGLVTRDAGGMAMVFVAMGLQLAGAAAGAVATARWAAGWRFGSAVAWRARLAKLGVGAAAGLVAVGGLAYPRHGFPGGDAPMAARHAWADTTFGTPYQRACAFVRGHAGVRARLGEVRAIAPAPGPNRTDYTPGELMGAFTLEVEGTKARGLARLTFANTTGTYRFWGTLEGPGGPTSLGGR